MSKIDEVRYMNKQVTIEDIEREIEIAFLNNYGNIEDDSKIERSSALEIMNQTIIILLEILNVQDIDVMQEVVDRFSGEDNIDEHIIHDLLYPRNEYVKGYMGVE